MTTKLVGRKEDLSKYADLISEDIDIPVENYQFSFSYQNFGEIPVNHFYDKKTNTFPTGLLESVKRLLKANNLEYEVVDKRPKGLFTSDDLLTSPITLGGRTTEGKYAYQMDAINSIIKSNGKGILNLSVGSGKCLPVDTYLLTDTGYKTIRDILKIENISEGDSFKIIPAKKTYLINRYGKKEKVDNITINGIKPINRVRLRSGEYEDMTPNHPILILDKNEGRFIWKKSSELQLGDLVVSRNGANRFNNNSSLTKDVAYNLGLLEADGTFSQNGFISFNNNQMELIKSMEDFWKNEGFHSNTTYISKDHDYKVDMSGCRKVRLFMEKYGLKKGIAKDKEVPSAIFNGNRDIQLAFISGLFECEMAYSKDKKAIEFTSASLKLVKQITLMLNNLGIRTTLAPKFVKSYPNNKYYRIFISRKQTSKLMDILLFKTAQRNASKHDSLRNISNNVVSFDYLPNSLTPLLRKYKKSVPYKGMPRDYRNKRNNMFNSNSKNGVGREHIRRDLKMFPNGDPTLKDQIDKLVNPEIYLEEIVSIEEKGYQRTYDVSMPKTHSFIANGIVNHNTLLFSALAKIALPHLNDGEHILFFTSSKEIFKQTLKELEDMTGQEIGYYASKKYKDRPIMVVMLQSAYALYKIDPYKGLKLTPKDRELRKIKDVILPKISNGNSINALKAYLRFMKLDTKVAKNFKSMLENEIDTSGSDKELVDKLTAYANEFDERIEYKAKDSKEKKDFIVNLLNSAVFICNDECQHLTAESYYKVILACKNALVCVGLSGSLDPKNKLLQQRVKAIFEKVTYRVKLVDNVKRGVSVKPIIHMLSVNSPKNIASLREWPEVYATGIVHNEYRNNLIAKLVAEKAYPSGRVTLIIVNQIEHGNDLLKRLTDLGVPAVFIYGQSEDEYRRKSIQAMRDNKVKVAIATSILDEGVDVKTIKVLILAAAGKSYRTTIQRIGRSVRLGEFNDAHIFDFFDNQNYMLSRQSLERMNIYKEQQLEIKENK